MDVDLGDDASDLEEKVIFTYYVCMYVCIIYVLLLYMYNIYIYIYIYIYIIF